MRPHFLLKPLYFLLLLLLPAWCVASGTDGYGAAGDTIATDFFLSKALPADFLTTGVVTNETVVTADPDPSSPPLIPQLLWQVDMAAAFGSAGLMPMWQVSHRGGRLLDQRSDGWMGARLVTDWRHASNRKVGRKYSAANGPGHSDRDQIYRGPIALPGLAPPDREEPRRYSRWHAWKPDYRAGIEFIAKPESGETRIYEAFVQLRYGPFQVTGGRRSYTTGFAYDPLSTGSMGMSPNHAPFPRITAGIPHYIPIPFTFRLMEIKGFYSHGWLDDDRFTSDPWLHEKAVFLRTRSDWPVRLQGGFTHFALWGGNHPDFGPAPARFEDYRRVVFGQSADPSHESAADFQQWVANAIGDHLGVIEFGLGWELFGMEWDAYRQIFFEDGSGMRFYHNRDGLNGLRIRPGSRLASGPGGSGAGGAGGWGENRWIRTIMVEYLGTIWQSGPGPTDPPEDPDDPFYDPDEPYFDADYPYNFGGRDQYYNHYVYRNGWTYRDFTMGTPLLLQQVRGRFYYPDGDFTWRRFVSNRVQAWHIGLEGDLFGLADVDAAPVAAMGRVLTGYRLMVTRARHQGTYDNIDIFNRIVDPDAPFADKPVQYHTMLELSGRLPWFNRKFTSDPKSPLNDLRLTLALSMDAGELTRHTGILFGIRWGNATY